MRNEEKKIISVSFLILIAVIAWAIVVNINKKSDNSAQNVKNIKSVATETTEAQNKTTVNDSNTTTAASVPMKNDNDGVPVIMYHSVSDNAASSQFAPLRITNQNFDSQMKYLKDNNFTTLTMDEINDFLTNNKPIPQKSIVLTFDDGYEDNYTNVYPVLKKYGFKATIFVVADAIDKESNYLTSPQLKELQQNGIDIESGTDENVRISNLPSASQLESLKDSKSKLEALLNKKVNYVSYPFGSYNADTLLDAKNAGYTLGFSRDGKWTYKTDDKFKLSRVYISPQHTEADFENRVNNNNY